MTWTTATASVVMGLMLSTRAVRARTGPWFLDLHRFLGGISVVFLIAHMGTLWLDSYEDFGPRELFVPGASDWRTEAIAWGIIAAYLLIAVEVTSLLRSRVSKALWRVVHLSSFVAMVAGSYHAYLAGSDVENPVTWAIAGIGSLLVLGLVSMRLQRQDPEDHGSTSLADQRAVLEEMRKRLEELPIPESTPQPQISVTPNAMLPRRAPFAESLPGIATESGEPAHDVAPHSDPIGFSDDPFASVPLSSDEPELGGWANQSPADPFGVIAADGTVPDGLPADRTLPRRAEAEGRRIDPFEALGLTPAMDRSGDDGFPVPPPPAEAPELFGAAVDDEPRADILHTRFEPVVQTPSTIQAPATPTSGPPPLPDAVDPLTGEPDEAAYTAWLKDWLSYAEQYGDEAPEDPARRF
ncbi:MAG: ferric reductase-like transmembrane domain-containing protein [Acidimicrobiales bacterium]